jgi:hypothetical protein
VREWHEGRWVWINKSLDGLRSYESLCLECKRARPGASQPCAVARALEIAYAETLTGALITRCACWEDAMQEPMPERHGRLADSTRA